MKLKSIAKVFGLALGLAASASALAIPVADVGQVDSFIISGSVKPPNEANQEVWAEQYVGDLTYITKIENPVWELVEGYTSLYALYLGNYSVDYFVIKTGNNNPGNGNNDKGDDHFLFENLSSAGYAVVDLAAIGLDNIGKISHVTLFKGEGTVTVSEPASLALLGIALTGLAAARRRRQ